MAQQVVVGKEILEIASQFHEWQHGGFEREMAKRRLLMGEFVNKHGSNPDMIVHATKVLLNKYVEAVNVRREHEQDHHSSTLKMLTWSLSKSDEQLMAGITREIGKVEQSKEKITAYVGLANDLIGGDKEKRDLRLSEIRDGKLGTVWVDNVFSELISKYEKGGFNENFAEAICDMNRSLALRHRDLEHSLEAAKKREPFRIMKI